jgi:hypothetical protein
MVLEINVSPYSTLSHCQKSFTWGAVWQERYHAVLQIKASRLPELK